MNRQILLGVFFLIVLLLLGYYTLFLTDFKPFGEQHELKVFFPRANGLRQGDSVLVAGIRQGRVTQLAFDPAAELERRIEARILLDQEIVLHEGFAIVIEESTLLGGRQLGIDPGPPEAAVVPRDRPLFGTVEESPIDKLGDVLGGDTKVSLEGIVSNLDAIVADVRAGRGIAGRVAADEELAARFERALEGIETAADNVAAMTADARAGKGVVGRLLTDDELAARVSETMDRVARIAADLEVVAADVRAGKGVLGRVLYDEELAEDLAATADDFREITRRIRAGEGTIGRLLASDELARNLEEFVAGLDQGTLGRLASDDRIYEQLAKSSEDLAEITSAIRNGEGTIGKLVMDPEVYDQLKLVLRIATRSLEEYREAAPITAFTSVLFGAF